jgi:hypothetical protein
VNRRRVYIVIYTRQEYRILTARRAPWVGVVDPGDGLYVPIAAQDENIISPVAQTATDSDSLTLAVASTDFGHRNYISTTFWKHSQPKKTPLFRIRVPRHVFVGSSFSPPAFCVI